jgi:hypothetical protein
LTTLFNITLPLYLRQPSYHSFSAFDASRQNNICISLQTYHRRMCLPTKIILLIISCSLTSKISFRSKTSFVQRTEEQ